MKINNSLESGKYRLYFALSFVVFAVPLAFVLIEGFKIIYLILSLLGLFFYIYLWLKNPYFVSFETTHRSIIFRFYSAHPFLRKPKMYEIPLNKFAGYEIKKKAFAEKIIFKIKSGKKSAEYPPVSITILPPNLKEQMINELNTILKLKNFK